LSRRERGVEVEIDPDALRSRRIREELCGVGDDLVERERAPLGGARPREAQEPPDDPAAPLGLLPDRIEALALLVAGGHRGDELGVADHRGQRVVQLVRDAGEETAEPRQTLGPGHLFPQRHRGGDVLEHDDETVRVPRRVAPARDGDLEPRPVGERRLRTRRVPASGEHVVREGDEVEIADAAQAAGGREQVEERLRRGVGVQHSERGVQQDHRVRHGVEDRAEPAVLRGGRRDDALQVERDVARGSEQDAEFPLPGRRAAQRAQPRDLAPSTDDGHGEDLTLLEGRANPLESVIGGEPLLVADGRVLRKQAVRHGRGEAPRVLRGEGSREPESNRRPIGQGRGDDDRVEPEQPLRPPCRGVEELVDRARLGQPPAEGLERLEIGRARFESRLRVTDDLASGPPGRQRLGALGSRRDLLGSGFHRRAAKQLRPRASDHFE
jgi:hypothetical protein